MDLRGLAGGVAARLSRMRPPWWSATGTWNGRAMKAIRLSFDFEMVSEASEVWVFVKYEIIIRVPR